MPVATPERRVHCIRIAPVNGEPIRIALAYSDDLIMSNGAVYKGGIYAQPTDTSATLSGGPTVIDFGSVYSVDTITRDQIQSGYWDGARVYSFYTDWAFPVEDEEEDRVYTFGKIREEDERYTVEMMSLSDLMGQSYGRVISAQCTYTFTDSHIDGTIIASDRSRCRLNPADYTHSAYISSISSQLQFTAAEFNGLFDNDFFSFGEIIFFTGLNAGQSFKFVKNYTASGVITLAQPFYYPLQINDSFFIRAGCRKRFTEDCVQRFNNGKRFGAFPHVPQKSTVSKFGDQ